MSEIVIARPDEGAIKAEIVPVTARAQALTVTNQDEHESALAFIGDVGRTAKKVEALFAEPKRLAFAAHRAITAAEAVLLEPLKHAKQLAGRKCDTYESEVRARVEAEERAAREAARKQEEERQLRDAIEAEAAGDVEQAEAILAEPVAVPVIRVEAPVAKVAGVSARETWSAEVTDKMALIRHVAAHPELAPLLDANLTALNAQARSLKAEMRIPGVRAKAETVRSVRSAHEDVA